jgi:endonuclease/exonuclease/phosphatase family metal-dependent hydrolase
MLLPLGIHLDNPTNKIERAGLIADWINASDADVVLLQEVFHDDAAKIILEKCSAYESHRSKGFFPGCGLLTLSRIPIEKCSEISLSFRGGLIPLFFSKPIQVTKIQGGIVVYNLHLASSNYYSNNDSHEHEVIRECKFVRETILAEQVKNGGKWIVGGDFNYDRIGFIPEQLKGSTIDDAYKMDLSRTPVVEMDHVFCSGTITSWEKFSCSSDHLGVNYVIEL